MLIGAFQLGEPEPRPSKEGIHTQDRLQWVTEPQIGRTMSLGVGWEKANWLRDSMLSRLWR